MNYLNPVEYSKLIKSLMESESDSSEDTVPVVGEISLKERISKLSPDDKKQLEQYIKSIKEIKKSIYELVNKNGIEEQGGNMSSGLYLNPNK
jgi:hypothetical protein